jgi:hypothetical protein
MFLVIFLFFIITIFIFLIFYPFKATIFNDTKYLYIKISNIITLKLNLYALFDESNIKELKKQAKNIKILKKLQFKEIDIYIRGFNANYNINGAYYGIINAILPIVNNLLETQDIKFNYLVDYNGELYIKFKSIVKTRFYNIVKAFYGS